jgi:protein involved in polysaccharide export with SLBB domain
MYLGKKLSGDHEIDQSGQISLPLAGTIEALGVTQAEFEQALAVLPGDVIRVPERYF